MVVNIKLIGDFFEDKNATNVVIKIPMPPTAANAKCVVGKGRAKYEPGERALVWRISNFPGQTESTLDAVVDLITATRYDSHGVLTFHTSIQILTFFTSSPNCREKPWVRPPVSLDFQIEMYSCSGVQVRFLKVYEKSNYSTNRWVKYVSKAGNGEYQIRV